MQRTVNLGSSAVKTEFPGLIAAPKAGAGGGRFARWVQALRWPRSELKVFAKPRALEQAGPVTQPLALVCYEKLLPGSQLVNRLQDLGYRVQLLADVARLAAEAASCKPMVVLVDLVWRQADPCAAVGQLRKQDATAHIPVIGFADPKKKELCAAAAQAGATLVASDAGLLGQLRQLLEQALEV